MTYQVILPKSAQKELDRLPNRIEERMVDALSALKEQPRPAACKKLRGENAWRIRVGDYRAIYEIDDRNARIVVVTIGHRREVYR
jgi:mRNA interferase RelE/StbE